MKKYCFIFFALLSSSVSSQDLNPPKGHLFAPCGVGMAVLAVGPEVWSEMDPMQVKIGASARYYLIGLAHGKFGAVDPDGYAKVYFHFLDECLKDESRRIIEIGEAYR